jgi:hypothetical protein
VSGQRLRGSCGRRYHRGIVSIRAYLLFVSASLLGGSACASSPQAERTALAEPDPPPPVESVEEVSPEPMPVDEAEPEPRDSSMPTASDEPASPEPAAIGPIAPITSITGIPICDEYLALYERCEEHLRPQIMAGDRRFYRSEAASLQHLASTPEAANLPASCRSMLDQLRVDCPEPQRRAPSSSAGATKT